MSASLNYNLLSSHAYLLVGDPVEIESLVISSLENKGISLKGSPDFFLSKEKVFGIDEARELSARAHRNAFGEKKIFLLIPEKITTEAQNALLKTFEEPTSNTHFYLVLRAEDVVLPTLRSRTQVIKIGSGNQETLEAKNFLRQATKERLNFAKKFAEKEMNLTRFLDELLVLLRSSGAQTDSIEKVYKLRLYSDDRGTSPRLVLEHLSLVL
jgi:hypothetical protein